LDLGQTQEGGTKRVPSNSEKDGEQCSNKTVNKDEEGGAPSPIKLPCRLRVSVKGVEWFVYNRSAAYDAIVASMTQQDNESMENIPEMRQENVGSESTIRRRGGRPAEWDNVDGSSKDSSFDLRKDNSPLTDKSTLGLNTAEEQLPRSSTSQTEASENDELPQTNQARALILRFLPVHIECFKAAVVMGNENTKSVLITKVDKATGEIDATKSTTLDQYKQLISFKFEHPVIQMKPNDDYKEDQAATAVRIKRKTADQTELKDKDHHIHSHSFLYRQRRKLLHKLKHLVPALRGSVESLSSSVNVGLDTPAQNGPGSNNWQGLSRYLDESEQDDKARWSTIEYATVSTIVDSPEATMNFYWDVVGPVPDRRDLSDVKSGDETANINGDLPPEWGIDLSFKGALINYGPWADRQRADIQRVFFPSLCKDAVPSKKLMPGQLRVPTEFKLYIEFVDETVLRVPIREESKNWKWTKHTDAFGARQGQEKRNRNKNRKREADKGNPGPEIRPFGWLDIKVASNATLRYTMDMVAGPSGFSNMLELDLPSLEITTSVNHGLLWRSVGNRISCDLANPLQWNGYHSWTFDIKSSGLELFILREHVFLLIDLVDDWASGPPPEYLTFTPFRYLVNLHLIDFKIYLNVNDSNIINNPSDLDDNTFIIIFGSALNADICIPLDKYRPYRNDISFNVHMKHGGLDLHVPPWNTQATFLSSTELAQLKSLAIQGTYQYCSTTSTSNTDTLLLDIRGHAPTAQFYGFFVRYFLKVKDNYFGEDVHFKTLEEYQDVLRAMPGQDVEISHTQPLKTSNDLDVILSVSADESSVILPTNLYSAKNHISIDIGTLAADLRFTNYYMDIEVVLSTLAFAQGNEDDGTATPNSATSSTQLFVDGINVTGNRLFGLPPTEPTYVCNWDFAVGAITGECTTDFFSRLARGARAFLFSFDDDENALPLISEAVLHDITFLRAWVDSIRIWLHVEDAAFLLSTGKISMNFNDWAGSHYSKKLRLQIPDLHLSCVDAESASRHRSRAQHPVETHAAIETTLSLVMIQKNLKFAENRQLQQEHVKRHDQRTHRADFLLHQELLDDSMLIPVDPPAMCVPPLPPPVFHDGSVDSASMASKKSSVRRGHQSVTRKSSFLSISSSSQRSDRSVLRPQSSLFAREPLLGDSRSRSLVTGTGSGPPIRLRDASTSTGRQSSFYSAVGDHRSLQPTNIIFSSPFLPPYFPLESVEPDTKDLPPVSLDQEDAASVRASQLELEDVNPDNVGEDTTQTSFIVELSSGIRGVCNPKAVHAVAGLLTAMQAVDPVDILDELQIDSMNELFDLNKHKIRSGKILDFSLRTPGISLRFLNSTASESSRNPRDETHDQYDLSMSGLAVTYRSKILAMDEGAPEDARDSSVLHFSLVSAGLAAKERFSNLTDPQAAVNGVVEDVIFWTASGEDTSMSVVFRLVELMTSSGKVEYLASLVHRTNMLINNLRETFISRINQQKSRVRLFAYLVATAGQEATDPLFLTRPSYVLRSAPDHLRTSDSWKIVTRLHHMYTSLDPATQQDIAMRCLRNSEPIPENSQQRVLAVFEQWRNWDLNNINSCLVISKIYKSADQPEVGIPQKSRPMKLSFRTELVRLILDPGPKQNEVSLSAVTTMFENKEISQRGDELSPTKLPPIQNTVVQVFCADISMNLNWELCELADDILKLYHESEPPQESSVSDSLASTHDTASNTKRNLHVVVATKRGSISIETINIKAVSISKGLTASFVMSNEVEGSTELIGNLMIAAEAATSRVWSHSQELATSQLRHPSVYGSYEEQISGDKPNNVVKLAGNCQELTYIVRQDILALIEVLDLIVGDEVAQIYLLKESKPAATSPITRQPSGSARPPLPISRVNITLFLDKYDISIPLLQSLTYHVSGVVARTSVAAQLESEVIFDFDIKEHFHDIQTLVTNKTESISLLQMPPINGRITTRMSEEENLLSVYASVEPIELDAAAIHSIMTALNRPEISSVLADIKEDAKAVQAHIEEIFGRHQKRAVKKSPRESKPLIYDAHLTLAGFDVFANAQGTSGGHNAARLDFHLGCVQVILSNRLEREGPALVFPELRIGLRRIMIEMSRWNNNAMEPCGNLAFVAFLNATSKKNDLGEEVRSYHLRSDALEINLLAETASSVVDIMGHLQDKIKDLDLTRERKYFRKLRKPKPRISINEEQQPDTVEGVQSSAAMFASMYSLELLNIQVSWLVGKQKTQETDHSPVQEMENLVLSLKRIDLSTKKENSARLTIEDLQLQMVPESHDKSQRSLNSALLPEVIFNVGYVSTGDARRLAFQAAGKSLDLRLTSQFIIPASQLHKSISSAADKVGAASASWTTTTSNTPVESSGSRRQPFFGTKRMESLLVDADFAGAVVYLSGKKTSDIPRVKGSRIPQTGRYGQFTHSDASSNTVLRTPGLAWKVEYKDSGLDEPSLNAEVKVDASSNILYPAVVPLILEITSTVKEVVSDNDKMKKPPLQRKVSPQKSKNGDEENILTADPSAVLGRTKLNLGVRICRQEFSLSCQPIARVAATARFDDIYLTANTVRSIENGHFFAVSAAITRLRASVQHVYSRESTGSFDVDTVFLSLMNSKHVSGTSGLSAILKISPMKVLVNAKQLQDFLLFREIWVPIEIRQSASTPSPTTSTMQSQTFLVQRYQQVAATGAFPWNATVSIAELEVQLDFGQAIGKSAFMISKFWISSKKNSDWEQNLCMGFDKIGVDSTGRMSGFVALQDFRIRTSIQWPAREMALNQTPLVQGSVGFSQLRVKAAFDYQAFLVADITSFEFLMYNVRNGPHARGDRLVAILDGEAVQVFCTTTTASQAIALYQAFLRLAQEKKASYEASLTEIEKFMKRKSTLSHPVPSPSPPKSQVSTTEEEKTPKSPISLHSDVIVTLKAVNMGAFPNTFSDHQVFKIEALDAQARFAVTMDAGKLHSILGLTLGQLRIGLAGVKRVEIPKSVGDISVEDVVSSATGSRGGTILKVPKVEASMQTWHVPSSNHIDYIFKSSFEGKVEVGWNYSRISYIRSMWASHSKALAQRLGKPLPPSAVKITGVPDEEAVERKEGEQQKITAEVNVPQSKYDYTALEPPIIETPQLRDMGEAVSGWISIPVGS